MNPFSDKFRKVLNELRNIHSSIYVYKCCCKDLEVDGKTKDFSNRLKILVAMGTKTLSKNTGMLGAQWLSG